MQHLDVPPFSLTFQSQSVVYHLLIEVPYSLVTCTFDTGHERISPLWPLGTNTVAFCGKEKDKWRLTACNLQHCGEMRSTKLEKGPQAIAEVELAGNHASWCPLRTLINKSGASVIYLNFIHKCNAFQDYATNTHRSGKLLNAHRHNRPVGFIV